MATVFLSLLLSLSSSLLWLSVAIGDEHFVWIVPIRGVKLPEIRVIRCQIPETRRSLYLSVGRRRYIVTTIPGYSGLQRVTCVIERSEVMSGLSIRRRERRQAREPHTYTGEPHTHIYARRYVHTRRHARTYAHIHTHTHTLTHTRIHTCKFAHTTDTHTHTHINTHSPIQ